MTQDLQFMYFFFLLTGFVRTYKSKKTHHHFTLSCNTSYYFYHNCFLKGLLLSTHHKIERKTHLPGAINHTPKFGMAVVLVLSGQNTPHFLNTLTPCLFYLSCCH